MNLFSRLMEKLAPPASRKFFLQLKDLAEEVRRGSQTLKTAVNEGRLGNPGFTAELHAIENKADTLTDRILLSIRQTMIHPVDPDDLRDIADGLDSVMDTMDHFAWRMEAYQLSARGAMEQMVGNIHEMAGEMCGMFDALVAADLPGVDARYRRLSDLEKQADGIFHNAVKKLHADGSKTYTVEDEVLSILEECSDLCKEVGRFVVVMLERNR